MISSVRFVDLVKLVVIGKEQEIEKTTGDFLQVDIPFTFNCAFARSHLPVSTDELLEME